MPFCESLHLRIKQIQIYLVKLYIIFHQPRFPWNFWGFPLLNHHHLGSFSVVWGRDEICPDIWGPGFRLLHPEDVWWGHVPSSSLEWWGHVQWRPPKTSSFPLSKSPMHPEGYGALKGNLVPYVLYIYTLEVQPPTMFKRLVSEFHHYFSRGKNHHPKGTTIF